MKTVLAIALIVCGSQAGADVLSVNNVQLLCDRDAEIPVVFVTGPEDSVAVLQIEGRQILLYQEPSASGIRYSWPSGGASYVLRSKGNEATILWREAGDETQILTCVVQM